MKWQKALTKKQMAHLRWTVSSKSHGIWNTPTLGRFRILRTSQRRLEANELARSGNMIFACHDCNEIERRLVAAGKMEAIK